MPKNNNDSYKLLFIIDNFLYIYYKESFLGIEICQKFKMTATNFDQIFFWEI
jgi:hypothetical protein